MTPQQQIEQAQQQVRQYLERRPAEGEADHARRLAVLAQTLGRAATAATAGIPTDPLPSMVRRPRGGGTAVKRF